MGGLIQQSPVTEESGSHWRAIALGVGLVVVVMAILALVFRGEPKRAAGPPSYVVNLKFSELKMSAAENFVGATVTYLDGTLTNTGDKTLTHAVVRVTFRNSLGENAQSEDVALHVLQTGGPYPDAVDLSLSPLGPGQSKPFRLTFEHVTADWNRQYPELQVTDVRVQ